MTKNLLESIDIITQDSRRARPGALFFALRGDKELKLRNIKDAISKDTTRVVHDIKSCEHGLYVEDIDALFTECLKALYKDTFNKLKVYGVTGTNGKTTYSYMLKSLLESYSVPTGIFGTVENSFKDNTLDTGLTSPMAEDFYAFSDEQYQNHGMKALVCEVSSHALDQRRMGLDFLDAAAFTSFSQDHLDYHKSMESYLEAKLKIKTEALKSAGYFCASPQMSELLNNDSVEILNFGKYEISSRVKGFGQEIEFISKADNKKLKGFLPLLGEYNIENFGLALMTLCHHFGADFFPDQRIFESFAPPPGRMEPVFYNKEPIAYVDYSHTPDSLEKALLTLKSMNKKMILVFGCGGNRDKDKRPLMGKVASKLADYSFISSDNPRNEKPETILLDIAKGFSGSSYEKIENRSEAIKKALEMAKDEMALVLIAGKGHEKTQEIKGKKTFFSDVDEVLNWVAKNES